MTIDEKVAIYNKGYKEGETHSQPSPESTKRLSKLEDSFVTFTKDFAVFTQKTDDYHESQCTVQEKILKQTTATNGRVTKIEAWKSEIRGAKKAYVATWSVLGVFFVAAGFGLFQTYITVQQLPYLISSEVTTQMQQINFELYE